MKRSLASLQLDRNRILELFPLFLTEHLPDRIHVARQARDRKQVPKVAARYVLQTAVISRRIIQSDPACQVLHWSGSGPVGIVLVPRHDAPVSSRFAEKLIVPETDRSVT